MGVKVNRSLSFPKIVGATFFILLLGYILFHSFYPIPAVSLSDLGYVKSKQGIVIDGVVDLYTKDGKQTIALSSYQKGPFLLHFWAPWCGPCKKEMPSLSKFSGYPVVCVASGDVKDIKKFYQDQEITEFEIIVDASGNLFKLLHITSFPTTLLINAKGEEDGRFQGAIKWRTPGLFKGLQQELKQ